jgi:peptide/nickel transport system ATP-binding protein
MNTGSRPALLRVEHVSVAFKGELGQRHTAVNDVSFTIPADHTLALVGESGSGKTVSALAIMGLLPRESALVEPRSAIHYAGRDLLKLSSAALRGIRGKEISMIFQEPMSSLNPVLTVGEQIMEALRVHLRFSKTQAKARAAELLAAVGLGEPARRLGAYAHELSGGQQQRVMIALAIACEPKLLIADEPTTALDVTVQKQILELIAALRERLKMSVVFITHDLDLVAEMADSVVVMRNGEIQEDAAAAQIFEAPRHPYTKALLACRPRLDAKPARLPVIEDFLSNGVQSGERVQLPKQPTNAEQIVLKARGVRKDFSLRAGWFGRRAFPAVKNVSFDLAKGETLGLVGESGCGKSTLGLTLLRLLPASGGEAWFDGKNILALSPREFMPYKRRIQIIFQNPYASLNPRFSVGHLLTEPMRIHGIGADERERGALAVELLDKVGLAPASLHKFPHEFSGGQRQRIAIARCLTLRPEVLICDEPVSALDVSIQAQVLNLLKDLQEEFGLSYLFISHDLAVVKYIADKVMVMRDGEIVESASAEDIYLRPQHAYTRQLLAAIPSGLGRPRERVAFDQVTGCAALATQREIRRD